MSKSVYDISLRKYHNMTTSDIEMYTNSIREKIYSIVGNHIPIFILYASPEIECWFIANWDNGFGYIYAASRLSVFYSDSMKQFLPEANACRLLPDSAHDTMRRDGTESIKGRIKFKCPEISFAGRNPSCTCENPCSDAKYGRTVHLVMADSPGLFNDPPRNSEKWDLEYNARTSACPVAFVPGNGFLVSTPP